ncbi:MAG: hypothetical protein AAFU80_06820 [Pseudomonadota bacterium]
MRLKSLTPIERQREHAQCHISACIGGIAHWRDIENDKRGAIRLHASEYEKLVEWVGVCAGPALAEARFMHFGGGAWLRSGGVGGPDCELIFTGLHKRMLRNIANTFPRPVLFP